MNTKWINKIARAKRSRVGRAVCRLAGDKTGAVMMEYVILAVLIAAACVVAVTMFGESIFDQFRVASQATVQETEAAAATAVEARTIQAENEAAADDYRGTIHNQ